MEWLPASIKELNANNERTKLPMAAAVPSVPARAFGIFLKPKPLIRNPIKGKRGIRSINNDADIFMNNAKIPVGSFFSGSSLKLNDLLC